MQLSYPNNLSIARLCKNPSLVPSRSNVDDDTSPIRATFEGIIWSRNVRKCWSILTRL